MVVLQLLCFDMDVFFTLQESAESALQAMHIFCEGPQKALKNADLKCSAFKLMALDSS